jgi:hypothetical protein
MFTRLAKSGLVKFWPVQPQRIAQGLHRAELFNRSYSNDNLPGFRRPAATGKRRYPTSALACHWFNRNGRLECRWQVADGAPIADADEQQRRVLQKSFARVTLSSERRSHGASFSAKAIGDARAGLGSGHAPVWHRSLDHDLQNSALTVEA